MKLDDAFGIHAQALQLRARRSEVLAANLANADTPGYQARDFDFRQALAGQLAPPVRLAATSSGHIQPDQTVPGIPLSYRMPFQASLDGNTVEAEREQAEFSANALQYQASVRFLDDRIKGLLSAIRGE